MFYVLLRSSFRLLALAFVSKRPPQEQVKKIAQPNRYPGDIFSLHCAAPGRAPAKASGGIHTGDLSADRERAVDDEYICARWPWTRSLRR